MPDPISISKLRDTMRRMSEIGAIGGETRDGPPPATIETHWVQITSTTQTAGRYPGTRYDFDAQAQTYTAGETIWVDTPNGESLATDVYYMAKIAGVRSGDGIAIYQTGTFTPSYRYRCIDDGAVSTLHEFLVTAAGEVDRGSTGVCCECAPDPGDTCTFPAGPLCLTINSDETDIDGDYVEFTKVVGSNYYESADPATIGGQTSDGPLRLHPSCQCSGSTCVIDNWFLSGVMDDTADGSWSILGFWDGAGGLVPPGGVVPTFDMRFNFSGPGTPDGWDGINQATVRDDPCSGTGTGGGSGDDIETTCCVGVPIPRNLLLTFTNRTGGMTAESSGWSNQYGLLYSNADGKWHQDSSLCSGTAEIVLECSGVTWYLQISGGIVPAVSASSTNCAAPELVFHLEQAENCAGSPTSGTAIATITDA